MELEYVHPAEIEKRSFEIITSELEKMDKTLPEDRDYIIKRAIHTTADFDYADTMYFSEDAVDKALTLIKNRATVVTDTNMALSGINKKTLSSFGGDSVCYMADEEVCEVAKRTGCTRAAVSMEKASKIEKPVIFAIGNAPTALVKLREMYDAGIYRPAFIIGVPVGFVNVEAAKELIMDTDIPCIINRGRKGGSNVAAAIVNALLYRLRDIGASC